MIGDPGGCPAPRPPASLSSPAAKTRPREGGRVVQTARGGHRRPPFLGQRLCYLAPRYIGVSVGSVGAARANTLKARRQGRVEKESRKRDAGFSRQASRGAAFGCRREGRIDEDRLPCPKRSPRLHDKPLVNAARNVVGIGGSWQMNRLLDPEHDLALDVAAQP